MCYYHKDIMFLTHEVCALNLICFVFLPFILLFLLIKGPMWHKKIGSIYRSRLHQTDDKLKKLTEIVSFELALVESGNKVHLCCYSSTLANYARPSINVNTVAYQTPDTVFFTFTRCVFVMELLNIVKKKYKM